MSKTNELLLGIDFGTTNTIITKFSNNKVEIINDGINNIIPSKIGLYQNNVYCGNYIPKECTDIISNFKLEIGEKNTYYNLSNSFLRI
jgi:molecular chaperone DnaK (HSP70)